MIKSRANSVGAFSILTSFWFFLYYFARWFSFLFSVAFFLIFVRIDIVYMPRARRCSAKLNINTLFPISLYHRSFTPAQGVQRELKMAFWVYMDFNKKFAASLDLSSSQSHGRYRRVERVSEIAWIRNNQVPQLYQQG